MLRNNYPDRFPAHFNNLQFFEINFYLLKYIFKECYKNSISLTTTLLVFYDKILPTYLKFSNIEDEFLDKF